MSVQKIPIQRSLPAFTKSRILDEIKKRGYALPCHLVKVAGPLVTVAFDLEDVSLPQVTIPTYGSQYQRQPYQGGDPGFTFPLAVDISAVAGLGAGLPSMDLPANLSSLFWFPGSTTKFTPAEDPDAHIICGKNGFILRDLQNLVSIVGNPNDGITMSFANHTIEINSTGVFIDGLEFVVHEHTAGTYVAGSTAVTGTSGGVVGG